jgi:hypothetical protein
VIAAIPVTLPFGGFIFQYIMVIFVFFDWKRIDMPFHLSVSNSIMGMKEIVV